MPATQQRGQDLLCSFWNRFTAIISSGSKLGLHPRTVVDGLLNNLFVPFQGLVELVHPDRVLVLGLPVDERNTVGGLLDDELLFGFHLELELAVEGDPSSGTRIFRKSDRDLGVSWKDDRSEGKRVGADGGQADNLGLRVSDGSTTGHVVGSGSSRCS